MASINSPVLVLNQNYEPLNVCRARRAVVLVWKGKAEVLEADSGTIHGPTLCLPLPAVIRLVYLIRRPRPQQKLTRREVFRRDNYTCQYCGKRTYDLTVDHVIPRHLGGKHTWDNVVSACKACNHHKAGRPPSGASVKLLRQPTSPPASSYYIVYQRSDPHPLWQKYIPIKD